MLILSGPRQVGKTTTVREAGVQHGPHTYLSWDNIRDRQTLLQGSDAIAQAAGLERLHERLPLCILDEVHKYGRWKDLLKGVFDTHGQEMRLLVTGSARMDVFRSGGDSLMGRYFPYRMHPLSAAELVGPALPGPELIAPPSPLEAEAFEALLRLGGFPEPLTKGSDRFWRRWRRLRSQQLLREDLRDLTRIQELDSVELLAELLRQRAGQQVSYSSLSRQIRASVDSIRRWVGTLETLYFCFAVRPWHSNISRSLRKGPKVYLWDWSQLDDEGARAENLVASALLKASLSPQLAWFQAQTGARHAFQVAVEAEPVQRDCFEVERPIIVPAITFLTQLA